MPTKTVEVVEFSPFEGEIVDVSVKEKGGASLWFRGEDAKFNVFVPKRLVEASGGFQVGQRVVVGFVMGRFGLSAKGVTKAMTETKKAA